jgi:hypothetical protein
MSAVGGFNGTQKRDPPTTLQIFHRRIGVEVGSEIWDRFTVHFTPTHGNWLNQAEIEIGIFSRQCLGTRRIPDLKSYVGRAEHGIAA